MENRSDYEKRLGEKLEAAYMLEDNGPGMSREEFHRLIMAAEKKKKRRRSLLGLVAACVALCLVCGGFMAGMTMRESASAGKDDETKTVQQGDSVVIGSGINEKNQNVGVSTKTYTDIEDIPEDVRKEIHFLDSDEFELEKVKVTRSRRAETISSYYLKNKNREITVTVENKDLNSGVHTLIKEYDRNWMYKNISVYEKESDTNIFYLCEIEKETYYITLQKPSERGEIEAILDGLTN